MPTKNYNEMLSEDLRDTEIAGEYLSAALEAGGTDAFLRALKNVIEAHGGEEILLDLAGLSRKHIEEIFSLGSNPTLRQVQSILRAVGLCFTFSPEEREGS